MVSSHSHSPVTPGQGCKEDSLRVRSVTPTSAETKNPERNKQNKKSTKFDHANQANQSNHANHANVTKNATTTLRIFRMGWRGLLVLSVATCLSWNASCRLQVWHPLAQSNVATRSDAATDAAAATDTATDTAGLWVIVPYYSEGISGWMISFAELLVFCKTYNATLVLPTIQHGRLTTLSVTTDTPTDTPTGMPILDFYVSSLIQQYHPALVTMDEYQEAIRLHHPAAATTVTATVTAPRRKTNNRSSNVVMLVKKFTTCMTYWPQGCIDKEQKDNVPAGRYGRIEGWGEHSPTVDAALQYTKDHPNHMVVLELYNYAYYAFSRKELRTTATTSTSTTPITTKLISDDEVEKVLQSVLQFHPRYEDLATVALQGMGIAPGQPYLTFHWRGEKDNLDYMKCAQALVESKNFVLAKLLNPNKSTVQQRLLGTSDNNKSNNNTTLSSSSSSSSSAMMPVVLMSSLNTNTDMQWAGAKKLAKNTSAPEALHYLLRTTEEGGGGFLKLDSVLSQVLQSSATTTTTAPPDMIVTVVLDLIIAMKSQQFVTCTKDCIHSFCSDCNVFSKFGNFTMVLRQRQAMHIPKNQQGHTMTMTNGSAGSGSGRSRSTPTAGLPDVVDPTTKDYKCWPPNNGNQIGTDQTTT